MGRENPRGGQGAVGKDVRQERSQAGHGGRQAHPVLAVDDAGRGRSAPAAARTLRLRRTAAQAWASRRAEVRYTVEDVEERVWARSVPEARVLSGASLGGGRTWAWKGRPRGYAPRG